MSKKENLSTFFNILNKPGLYIPASAAMLVVGLSLQPEIRQAIGADPSLENSTLPLEKQTATFKKSTARHEAAHMVAALVLQTEHLVPENVTIKPEEHTWGLMQYDQQLAKMAFSKNEYTSSVIVSYAAGAAEKYFDGAITIGSSGDTMNATNIAMRMAQHGMGQISP